MPNGYPIIYLRGYAMNQAGVEATVDDPFYGFNTGSTHVRVGKEGKPEFFAFESPILRLMGDHGYADAYGAGLQTTDPRRRPQSQPPGPRSIWIYRYYDPNSHTFPDSERRRLEIEDAAEGLREFIDRVRVVTSGDEPTERVVLVGHSTGGLIIRSLLQRAYPLAGEDPADHVDKAFTYATPPRGNPLRSRRRPHRGGARPHRVPQLR